MEKNAPPLNEVSAIGASSWTFLGSSGGGAGYLNLFTAPVVSGTSGGCYMRINDGKKSTLPGISSLYPNTYFAAGGFIKSKTILPQIANARDSSGNLIRSGYGGGGGGGGSDTIIQSGQYYFTLNAYSYTNYGVNAAQNSGSGGSGVTSATNGSYTSGKGGSGIVMISVLISLISN